MGVVKSLLQGGSGAQPALADPPQVGMLPWGPQGPHSPHPSPSLFTPSFCHTQISMASWEMCLLNLSVVSVIVTAFGHQI